MNIELDSVKSSPYSNFIDSIRNSETRRQYTSNLKAFLDLIPNSIFEEYSGSLPESRSIEDMSGAFLDLAKKDPATVKSIIKSYLKELARHFGKVAIVMDNAPQHKAKIVKEFVDWNLDEGHMAPDCDA